MTRAGVPFCALGLVAKSYSRHTVPIAPIVDLRACTATALHRTLFLNVLLSFPTGKR